MENSNSLTRFKDPSIDPLALEGLKTAYGILEKSKKRLSLELDKTKKISEESLAKIHKQFGFLDAEINRLKGELIEEKSFRRKMEITYQGQIKALETKIQLTEKSLQEARQETAHWQRQAEIIQQKGITNREEALKILKEAHNARIMMIWKQLNPTEKTSLKGHDFSDIGSFGRLASPNCDCHSPKRKPGTYFFEKDPLNFCNTFFRDRYPHFDPSSNDWFFKYHVEVILRMLIAEKLDEEITNRKKISSSIKSLLQ